MDIDRFSKQVKGLEHETTFHFCWSRDRYEGYVILYNELFCFDMIKANGNWEFVNEDELPMIMSAFCRELNEACENHYQKMKALLKK